ncbi:MAG TPA: hypothetical protein VKK19_18265 [Candidatus Dormibacteraeota bacterium]|nr:hypothetical protein [Candidatus Dormibacteraeota bacterium]
MTAQEFLRSVESFPVAERPLVIEPAAERQLRSCIAGGGPILLGEMHGALENPLVIWTLLSRLSLRVLALEWDFALAAVVHRYGDGDGLDFSRFDHSCDGRITAGHFAVIRDLHRRGRLDRLTLFSGPSPTEWSERDRLMAGRLIEGLEGASPALVVAGGLHTRLEPHEHGVPMGYHVAMKFQAATEVRMRYLCGEIFNAGLRRVGGGHAHAQSGNELKLVVDKGRLSLIVPVAHPATVPDPGCRH